MTIKSILRYEQLVGQPLIGTPAEEVDSVALLYVLDSEAYLTSSLETFRAATEGSQYVERSLLRLADEVSRMQQYMSDGGESEEATERKPTPLWDIVEPLVAFGVVSVDYLMERMDLWELPLYLNALSKRQRYEMEGERLWAYLGILPHIDSKQLSSPQKLLRFSWEEEEENQANELAREIFASRFSEVTKKES